MLAADKPPLNEVYLEHYGVKGMKWGVRKVSAYNNTPDASGVTRKQARVENRGTRRNLRRSLEDFESSPSRERDQAILKARMNRVSAERKYSDVKRELKGKKGELGRNAVRVQLAKARAEKASTVFKSEQMTSGEKLVNDLLNIVDDMTGSPRRRYVQTG